MNLLMLLDEGTSGRVCLTLLHSLWQVALLAAVMWVIDRLWCKSSVERGYALHVAALLLALAALPITYALLPAPIAPVAEVAMPVVEPELPLASPGPVADIPLPELAEPALPIEPTMVAIDVEPVTATVEPEPAGSRWMVAAPWIVAFYATGVVVMLLRLAVGSAKAHAVCRRAQRIVDGPLASLLARLTREWSLRVRCRLAQSTEVVVPQVIGLVRPTILLPAAALTGLAPRDLELILVHELAHIRRHDVWVNFLQRLAEAVLFFNPGLWYLSRRIGTLREYCCDELACRDLPGDTLPPRVEYATALLNVVELARPGSRTPELGALAASGRGPSELRRRVARLFGEPLREPLRLSRGGVLAAVGMAVVLVVGPAWMGSRARGEPDTPSDATDEISEAAEITVIDDKFVVAPVTTPLQRTLLGSIERPADDVTACLFVNLDGFPVTGPVEGQVEAWQRCSAALSSLNVEPGGILAVRLGREISKVAPRKRRLAQVLEDVREIAAAAGFADVRVKHEHFGPNLNAWRNRIRRGKGKSKDDPTGENPLVATDELRITLVTTPLSHMLVNCNVIVDYLPVVRDKIGHRFEPDVLPAVANAVRAAEIEGGEAIEIRFRQSQTVDAKIWEWLLDPSAGNAYAQELGFDSCHVSRFQITETIIGDRFIVAPVNTPLERSLLGHVGRDADRAAVCVMVNANAFPLEDEIGGEGEEWTNLHDALKNIAPEENGVAYLRIIDGGGNLDSPFHARQSRMESLEKLLKNKLKEGGFASARVAHTYGNSRGRSWKETIELAQGKVKEDITGGLPLVETEELRVMLVSTFLARMLVDADCVVDWLPVVRDADGSRLMADVLPAVAEGVEKAETGGGETLLIRLRFSETEKASLERWANDIAGRKAYASGLGFEVCNVSQSQIAKEDERKSDAEDKAEREHSGKIIISDKFVVCPVTTPLQKSLLGINGHPAEGVAACVLVTCVLSDVDEPINDEGEVWQRFTERLKSIEAKPDEILVVQIIDSKPGDPQLYRRERSEAIENVIKKLAKGAGFGEIRTSYMYTSSPVRLLNQDEEIPQEVAEGGELERPLVDTAELRVTRATTLLSRALTSADLVVEWFPVVRDADGARLKQDVLPKVAEAVREAKSGRGGVLEIRLRSTQTMEQHIRNWNLDAAGQSAFARRLGFGLCYIKNSPIAQEEEESEKEFTGALTEVVAPDSLSVEIKRPEEHEVGDVGRYEVVVENVASAVVRDVEVVVGTSRHLLPRVADAEYDADTFATTGRLKWQIAELAPGARTVYSIEYERQDIAGQPSIRAEVMASQDEPAESDSSALSDSESDKIAALEQLVDSHQRVLTNLEVRRDQGGDLVSLDEIYARRIALFTARAELALAKGENEEAVEHMKTAVKAAEEGVAYQQQAFEVGNATPDSIDDAKASLAMTRIELAELQSLVKQQEEAGKAEPAAVAAPDPDQIAALEELVKSYEQIYESVKARYDAKAANGSADRLYSAQLAMLTAKADLETAKGNFAAAVDHYKSAVEAADKNVEAHQKAYEVGTITLDAVLEANRKRAEAKLALSRAQKRLPKTEAPAEATEVTTWCVDTEGNPVAGAEVYVFQRMESGEYRQFGPFATDERGQFSYPQVMLSTPSREFDHCFYARVPGKLVGVARWTRWDGEETDNVEFRIKMRPSRTVSGQLTGPEGFDLSQVKVRVDALIFFNDEGIETYGTLARNKWQFPGMGDVLPEIFERSANEHGRFEFADVPVKGVLLFRTNAEGLADAQGVIDVQTLDKPASLRLEKESRLIGRALAKDGRPLAGIKIMAHRSPLERDAGYPTTFSATSDDKGQFAIGRLPDWELIVTVDDPNGEWMMYPLETLSVPAGTTHNQELRLTEAVEVKCRIVDQDDNPWQNAGLRLVTTGPPKTEVLLTVTDSNGVVTFDAAPGTYEIVVDGRLWGLTLEVSSQDKPNVREFYVPKAYYAPRSEVGVPAGADVSRKPAKPAPPEPGNTNDAEGN